MYDRIKEKIKYEMSHYYGKEVSIVTAHKDNRELDAVYIKDGKMAPIIYLNDFIDDINDPIISDHDVIKKIIDHYDMMLNMIKPDFNPEYFFNWDKIKNSIYPMLLNYEKNKNFIGMADTYLDFLVGYYIQLDIGIIRIKDNMLKQWKVSIEDIREISAKNILQRKFLLQGLSKTVLEFIDEEDFNDLDISYFINNESIYVLNDNSPYGASQILNNNLLQKIYSVFGNYYILPSSIHEVLIAPLNIEGNNKDELKMAVKYTNSTVVIEEDFLSNNLYLYNGTEIKIVE